MGGLGSPTVRVYLDTNIFILLKEGAGEVQEALVDLLATALRTSSPSLVTSELTLSELLAKPYADGRDDLIEQYDNWIVTSNWLSVIPVRRDILWYAAVLRSRHRAIKLPNAIHLSTAVSQNCSHILTNDFGLKGPYSIVHTRHGLSATTPDVHVVRPDTQTLRNLKTELSAL